MLSHHIPSKTFAARCLLLLSAVLTCSHPGPAATFSANAGGTLGNSSIIDSRGLGDYVSLHDAAADFSGYPGGARADYTFFIRTDLNETSNSAFGNTTNGHIISLRPLGGVRTVTFLQTAPNTGQLGHLLIGARNTDLASDLAKTDRFLIDGETAATSRGLVLRNTAEAVAPLSDMRDALVKVVGNSDYVQIRNCDIEILSTGAASHHGVLFLSELGVGPNEIPDDGRVFNCSVRAMQPLGYGISSYVSGIVTSATAQRGHTLTSNTIVASARGITLIDVAGLNVTHNRIFIHQAVSDLGASGIYYSPPPLGRGLDHLITHNQIHVLVTAVNSRAVYGIYFEGGATWSSAIITNNLISVQIAHENQHALSLTGFGMSLWEFVRIVFAHNSMRLESYEETLYPAALWLRANNSEFQVLNNLVNLQCASHRYGARYSLGSAPFATRINTLISDGNVWCGPSPIYFSTQTNWYNSLAEWQAGGVLNDPSSQAFDLEPYWKSPDDLHLVARPTQMLPGVVTTDTLAVRDDVDGDPRNLTAPYRGADEYETALLPLDLAVEKSVPPLAEAGQVFRSTISVANRGPLAASHVTVRDELPPQLVVTAATATTGSVALQPDAVVLFIPWLEAGQTAQFLVDGHVDTTGTVVNVATVTSPDDELSAADDVATAEISIIPPSGADLKATWLRNQATTWGFGRVRISLFTGEVQVTNWGYAPAPRTLATVLLSDDAASGHGDRVVAPLIVPPLAPGQSFSRRIFHVFRGDLADKYAIAVADAGSLVDENVETDNVALLGLVPKQIGDSSGTGHQECSGLLLRPD